MSEKPVNLNRLRKDRARAEKKVRSDTNAAKYGRTKAERRLDVARAEMSNRLLDQLAREKE